jgi:hypothetical protein
MGFRMNAVLGDMLQRWPSWQPYYHWHSMPLLAAAA